MDGVMDCRGRTGGSFKKAIACILAMGMTLSLMLGMFPVTAMAATQADAKRYMDNNMGKQISSSRGSQCVELFNQYLEKVFGRTPPSVWNAYEIYDRTYSGWTKIPASQINNSTYQVGDIVVYSAGNGTDVGSAGHVALVYSASNGSVKLFEQNWAGNPRSALYNLHTARLKGIIRPAFSNPVCQHSYKIDKVAKAPTATEKGSWNFKCTQCGAIGPRDIPALTPSNLKDGYYMIASKLDTNKYVSVAPNQGRKEGNIALYSAFAADQIFYIKKKSNGTYTIRYGEQYLPQEMQLFNGNGAYTIRSGGQELVLDVAGSVDQFGTNVWLWTANGEACQDWYIVPAESGWYRFTVRNTYYNLDVANAKTDDGTNIGVHYDNGSNAQRFRPILLSCTDHAWDAGTVLTPASYTAAGRKQYTCVDCGTTKVVDIPKLKRSIEDAAVSGIKTKTWTGSALSQAPTVKVGSKTLKKGTDYTLSYKSNKNVGTATVTIKGKGAYTGSLAKTFKIIPKKTSLTSVKAGKKQLKCAWKKQAQQTTGYQIQYSTSSAYKNPDYITLSSPSAVSTTITGLAGGKTYYVRIRTYKKVSGKTYFSAWSTAVKCKTAK